MVTLEHFTGADVVARYGDACYYCVGPFEELDHVQAVFDGGPHTLENVRPACGECNRAKENFARSDRREHVAQ